MSKEQEKLEKEIEKLENISAGMDSKVEELRRELDKKREYIDAIILGNYNLGELQSEFKLEDWQAEKIYDMITDQYVRIWFKTGKLEVIHKE
ncbi:unnamed protein product [marine sediment metagenome]|uniref:Uncharacterized protein n=1 Tax=marine sediment metagenome TaxID=412755 RepID=X0UUP5_9ZZZZ